jgi:hypothetical protein
VAVAVYDDYGGTDEMTEHIDEIQRLKQENARLEQWVNDCQSGMYINCVYCGHRYGPHDPENDHLVSMREALHKHIEQCPKHPLSAMKRVLDAFRAASEFASFSDKELRDMNELMKSVNDPNTGMAMALINAELLARELIDRREADQ